MQPVLQEDDGVKILIVEDEPATAAYLRQGLSEEGFAVDVAANAADADEAVSVNAYDVVLLDVMLPGADGFTLCQRWRESGMRTPVMFLTARDEIRDRVRGLDLGGDDYLVKPFAFDELLARVRVLLRRGHAPTGTVLRFHDLEVDLVARVVRRGGRELGLTSRELQLLEYLSMHADRVVSRTDLWEHVWASGAEPESNAVDVYVRSLRNKIGRDLPILETVRGLGYMLRSRLEMGPSSRA